MIVLDTNLAAGNATTQYTDFNFNSIVKSGNKFLCAGENGLFRLEGSTKLFPQDETGLPITTSYFEPVTMDFGISNEKRLRAVYVGYESSGDILLRISTELGLEASYTLPITTSGQTARKTIVTRDLKGRYWTFHIEGTGVTFSVDDIKVLPIVRGHGFDQN